ncbi:MAG: hypothetical protein RLZZ380_978 [Actinomycetota bacterium]|jgi:CobQ-like glutamine amidotransferase family enzyme
MANFSILHLYPETLKFNGEVGNVLALKERATKYGLSVTVRSAEISQALPKIRPSLVFIGSGTLQATLAAAGDLATKESQLHQWVAAGTKILAVGTGFDLIAQQLILLDGTAIRGLGMTNTTHSVTDEHLVGEVVISKDVAGFINTNREIVRGDVGFELGIVRASDEKKLVGYVDGYSDGKVWATNVQGPFLPMNPKFADEIIASICPNLPKVGSLKTLDGLAKKTRNAISARVGN